MTAAREIDVMHGMSCQMFALSGDIAHSAKGASLKWMTQFDDLTREKKTEVLDLVFPEAAGGDAQMQAAMITEIAERLRTLETKMPQKAGESNDNYNTRINNLRKSLESEIEQLRASPLTLPKSTLLEQQWLDLEAHRAASSATKAQVHLEALIDKTTLALLRQETMEYIVEKMHDPIVFKVSDAKDEVGGLYVCGGIKGENDIAPEHWWLEDRNNRIVFDTFIDKTLLQSVSLDNYTTAKGFRPECEKTAFPFERVWKVRVDGYTLGQLECLERSNLIDKVAGAKKFLEEYRAKDKPVVVQNSAAATTAAAASPLLPTPDREGSPRCVVAPTLPPLFNGSVMKAHYLMFSIPNPDGADEMSTPVPCYSYQRD